MSKIDDFTIRRIKEAAQIHDVVADFVDLRKTGVRYTGICPFHDDHHTGNFKSDLYKRTGNLFGIKHDGRYAAYRHWRESIADYKKRISSRYKQGENYYAFLRRINYAEDGNYFRKLDKIIRTSK